MADLGDLTQRAKLVMAKYQAEHPEVVVDRDYYPFKVTEEWGECLQAYLMLTDRGRQKGLSKDEIRAELEKEIGDVFGFLMLFAEREGIDLATALEKKWLSRLEPAE
jgi:NTP pyrophosphatase (non-canonical NTP hydrolase)